jgi:hypothetical protein
MSIDQFTEAARRNFETFSAHPFYAQGVRALDVAYEAAIRSLPPDGHPAIYGRLLLVCHKHMVSAANLIASCLPEDSAGITRRAVEAAKVATATRLNDKNTEAWLSYEERNERWIRRQSNEKPKTFHVHFDDMKGDEFSEALDRYIGMLSDSYVHFTPEFYSTLCWEVTVHESGDGGQIFLNYFQSDTRELERHFLLLMAVHGKILQAFDRCLQGHLYSQPMFKAAADHLWRTAKILNDDYGRRYGVRIIPAEEA